MLIKLKSEFTSDSQLVVPFAMNEIELTDMPVFDYTLAIERICHDKLMWFTFITRIKHEDDLI